MPLTYDQILEYNAKWAAEKVAGNPDFFQRLSREQFPDYLFIGCSDSRADPDAITGLDIGDIFVHRNVANIVNPIDLNASSVVQYAVENLKVKHIIVCGHYGCGGIKAAMERRGLGRNSPWLQIIKDVYRIHARELEKINDEERRYDRLVELNVLKQVENVKEMDCLRALDGQAGCPAIHGWVYNIRNGRIIDLKIGAEADGASAKPSLVQRVGSLFKLRQKGMP